MESGFPALLKPDGTRARYPSGRTRRGCAMESDKILRESRTDRLPQGRVKDAANDAFTTECAAGRQKGQRTLRLLLGRARASLSESRTGPAWRGSGRPSRLLILHRFWGGPRVSARAKIRMDTDPENLRFSRVFGRNWADGHLRREVRRGQTREHEVPSFRPG
jgi:hypothetical protein